MKQLIVVVLLVAVLAVAWIPDDDGGRVVVPTTTPTAVYATPTHSPPTIEPYPVATSQQAYPVPADDEPTSPDQEPTNPYEGWPTPTVPPVPTSG